MLGKYEEALGRCHEVLLGRASVGHASARLGNCSARQQGAVVPPTVKISLISLVSSTPGTKPAPMPWILCGPGLPPLSTGLSAGSTATMCRLGFFSRRYLRPGPGAKIKIKIRMSSRNRMSRQDQKLEGVGAQTVWRSVTKRLYGHRTPVCHQTESFMLIATPMRRHGMNPGGRREGRCCRQEARC